MRPYTSDECRESRVRLGLRYSSRTTPSPRSTMISCDVIEELDPTVLGAGGSSRSGPPNNAVATPYFLAYSVAVGLVVLFDRTVVSVVMLSTATEELHVLPTDMATDTTSARKLIGSCNTGLDALTEVAV